MKPGRGEGGRGEGGRGSERGPIVRQAGLHAQGHRGRQGSRERDHALSQEVLRPFPNGCPQQTPYPMADSCSASHKVLRASHTLQRTNATRRQDDELGDFRELRALAGTLAMLTALQDEAASGRPTERRTHEK